MIKKNTAIICLSPNHGGMEIDSIKLAKKLSIYSKIFLIAKSGSFIESQQSEFLDYNNIKLEPITLIKDISWVYCVTSDPEGNNLISDKKSVEGNK